MRLNLIVLAALSALCATGALAGSNGDGSCEAHEGAWGGPGAATAVAHATAEAKPMTEFSSIGKTEYEQKCAGCHGMSGKGDGVSTSALLYSPADLTVLARTHGGHFPYLDFYGTVTGRHAENDEMPTFGKVYAEEPLDYRLVALATYVEDLQEK